MTARRRYARAVGLAFTGVVAGCATGAVTGDPSLARSAVNVVLLLLITGAILWDLQHPEE